MGEYAKHNGHQVKIGTCEDMYYLRHDQRHDVEAIANSLDPVDPSLDSVLRWRFPWPDEDGTPPGEFREPFRGLVVPGVKPPAEVDHSLVQFSAGAGYLLSLPCPEAGELPEGVHVHRNGFNGAVRLVQQKLVGRQLAIVCQCACGAKWRVEEFAEAHEIIEAIRNEARERDYFRAGSGRRYWQIADRIVDGYEAANLAATA